MINIKSNKILYIFYGFALTSLVFAIYMCFSNNDRFSPFVSPFDLTAQKPFVYRVLPSLIISGLSQITGVAPIISAILVMYFSLLGFFFVYSLLVKKFLPNTNLFISLIFPAMGIIPFLIQSRHVYDFPILFLFTLAYYLLEKKEFGKYMVVFILASLTKETTLFLILFFALHLRNCGRKQLVKMLISQTLIYGMIRGTLMIIFHENPGSDIQFHFFEHINSFTSHPWAAGFLYASVLIIFVIAMTYKGEASNLIKDALLSVGVPIAILYLFFGVPFEIRVFLEVFPVISLLFTLKIITLFEKIRPTLNGVAGQDT